MNKAIIWIVLAVLVGGGIYWFISQDNMTVTAPADTTGSQAQTPPVTAQPNPADQPAGSGPTSAKTFTAATVAKHNNAQSCYTIIRGNVYDLTSWISQHPGGEEAILSICGIDGTNAFVDQHGGRSRQEDLLATFQIGTLAK